MDYKVGDVANGHILGSDGVWHPIQQGAPRDPETTQTSDPNRYPTSHERSRGEAGYWKRWRRRFWPSVLGGGLVGTVLGLLGVALNGDSVAGFLAAALLSYPLYCVLLGLPLSFIAAVLPNPKNPQRR